MDARDRRPAAAWMPPASRQVPEGHDPTHWGPHRRPGGASDRSGRGGPKRCRPATGMDARRPLRERAAGCRNNTAVARQDAERREPGWRACLWGMGSHAASVVGKKKSRPRVHEARESGAVVAHRRQLFKCQIDFGFQIIADLARRSEVRRCVVTSIQHQSQIESRRMLLV